MAMFERFTARRPKAKKAAVSPLQEPEGPAKGAREAAPDQPAAGTASPGSADAEKAKPAKELGGPSGPEPTRYGDWERKGICVDF